MGTRFENDTFFRVLEHNGATLLLNGPLNYQNPVDLHDVNNNGFRPSSENLDALFGSEQPDLFEDLLGSLESVKRPHLL